MDAPIQPKPYKPRMRPANPRCIGPNDFWTIKLNEYHVVTAHSSKKAYNTYLQIKDRK